MAKAKVAAIAALGKNFELGAENRLLWHLPDDFAWFVKHTRGNPVVMGRKTMESLGKPLKNRMNIVISRHPEKIQEGFLYAESLEMGLNMAKVQNTNEVFVIGGGEIYRQSLPLLDRLYLTLVYGDFPEADTFFPDYGNAWTETFREHHPADDRHRFAFDFIILDKAE
jgi:dihydrofolate reductase